MHQQPTTNYQQPTTKEALRFWLKLGLISFGGPAGQIAIMHDVLVTEKKWISESRFLHALSYCMLLPGPEAQQLATYIGWLLHGVRGGLMAGILFLLPSMFILLGMSILYVNYSSIAWVSALFMGIKPAVVAIVIAAGIKIAKKTLKLPIHFVIALVAFVLMTVGKVPFPAIILGVILSAWLGRKWLSKQMENLKKGATDAIEDDESAYFLNKYSVVKSDSNFNKIARQLLIGLACWAAPMVLLYFFFSDYLFWHQMSLFFTKAAFVTFGGAYAVLPYVAQVSVEQFHWLTQGQMMDGLALGETTPGPLIMVLAFVGFMGGYQFGGFSVLSGILGLGLTTWFTFLPSFLFIFIGAPLIERTRTNPNIKLVLGCVSAAVVGVLAQLCLYLGHSVIFSDNPVSLQHINWVATLWILISVLALHRFKINMILWIGVSALMGLAMYLFKL
jgi:chromate transporter